MVESGIIYKIDNESTTDLVQNSFEGNDLMKIELPNIDNIRKKNLVKAFNLIDKQGTILIQTRENIYTYNISTFELKKFNRFKDEEVIFVDEEKEVVVTINTTNLNQFRFYDLGQNESKTFKVDDGEIRSKPNQIISFNSSQNLILQYGDKLRLVDIDGANNTLFKDFENVEVVLATKIDDQVQIVVKDNNVDKIRSEIKGVTTTPSTVGSSSTSSPTPSTSTSPEVIQPVQKYILRFEKFEN
jgi:hypothetical protein